MPSSKPMPQQPGVCDPRIYTEGNEVAVITGPRSFTLDAWIREVATRSGQLVDWHYVGGRARVLYIGDRKRVIDALAELWPQLIASYMACEFNFVRDAREEDVQMYGIGP